MKSIVVGFADEAGRSEPKVICGPEVSDLQQAKVFNEAKRKARYPKGVTRLEFAFFDDTRRNIAIRTGTISQLANHPVQ